MNRFRDRRDAGEKLAAALGEYADEQPIILALPRGGVPVGAEVAQALSAPLDVWIVRKIGVPWQPELGVGAVAEGGYVYINDDIANGVPGLTREQIQEVVDEKMLEVAQRVTLFRKGQERPDLDGRTVILVDDGIATGGTVHAALRSIRAENPSRIVLAVPVAPPQTVRSLQGEADDIIALLTPATMQAVGYFYADFSQVQDAEAVEILDQFRADM